MPHTNYLAIVVAAASSFLLGGLWYSEKLFGATWNREAGHGPKGPEGRHPARVFRHRQNFDRVQEVPEGRVGLPDRLFAKCVLFQRCGV